MKWLVTAFEPFGGATDNSSLEVCRQLEALDWGGAVEFFSPLPVIYRRAWPVLLEELKKRPQVGGILALGQAASRPRLSLERLALNWIDSAQADNEGVKPGPGPIGNGPETLWSPLPWERLGDDPAWERSYSAGTFVCNALFYELLNWAGAHRKLAGFVHVPVAVSSRAPLEKIIKFLSAL